MVVVGAAVLVSAWDAWEVLELDGKVVHFSPSVRTLGGKYDTSG